MSGPAIVQLQQLRQLRERRAQNHLTLQIQRCRAAQAAVEQAQQQVDVALEQLRQEATALQKLLGEGAVAVGTYQTALEMLDLFDQYRAGLLEQLHSAEQHHAEQEQHKLTLQRALLVRQQQCEALAPLLQAHQRQVWRDQENSEEELYDERAALRREDPSMNCRNSAFAERPSLPTVEPATLALHNRLQRRRTPLQVPFNGATLTLSGALTTEPLSADTYAIGFASGELHGCLRVPAQLLEHLLGNPALAAVFASLAATAQAVLLEQAVLPLLQPLEALLEQPLTLTVLREPAMPLPLGFALGVSVAEGETLNVPVELNVAAAQRVADWLDRWLPGQPQSLPALLLTVALHAGWQTLTLNEARSLNPGDVLMLEVPPQAELRVCLAGSRWARAVRQTQGIRLIESLGRVEPLMESAMSQTTQEPVADPSLGDLPLTVVCQVGSLQLSLAEVQQLAEGSVLSLPDSGSDTVELLVNGRSMGRGELVKIGDGLGVRLTRFARL